jgi:hypothetical protein
VDQRSLTSVLRSSPEGIRVVGMEIGILMERRGPGKIDGWTDDCRSLNPKPDRFPPPRLLWGFTLLDRVSLSTTSDPHFFAPHPNLTLRDGAFHLGIAYRSTRSLPRR